MVIFITGASGYLGSHLVKELSKENQVFSLMRKTSSKKRIEGTYSEVIYTDEVDVLERAFVQYNPDIIINTVALYGRKGESISELVNANIHFPTKLLQLAEKYDSKAFIHTGTSLTDDISPYALTKNTFVKLAKFNSVRSLKFVDVSLEHFYGPGDDHSKFTSYVINACIKGESLALTEGLQRRDFIYIEDVVEAYKTIVKNLTQLACFESIPVGSSTAPTVREFVELVHGYSNSRSTLEFGVIPMRDKELMYSCADVTRLRDLGWSCKVSLEQGIEKIVNGYGG